MSRHYDLTIAAIIVPCTYEASYLQGFVYLPTRHKTLRNHEQHPANSPP